MKVEPPLDHGSLMARVEELYGLDVAALSFVPKGETSVGYVVQGKDGRRYFLKLWPDTRHGRLQRTKVAVVLPLTRELYERDFLRDIPYPIPTLAGALHDPSATTCRRSSRMSRGNPFPARSLARTRGRG